MLWNVCLSSSTWGVAWEMCEPSMTLVFLVLYLGLSHYSHLTPKAWGTRAGTTAQPRASRRFLTLCMRVLMSTACLWRPLCQARTTLKGGQDFSQHETTGVHWKLELVSQLWQEAHGHFWG